MFKKAIPQHKRVAMGGGHTPLGYARGGTVPKPAATVPAVSGGVSAPDNPLTLARRTNGIPGMRSGGGVKGCKK